MVAVDAHTGTPVGVSGAALAAGPALALATQRRAAPPAPGAGSGFTRLLGHARAAGNTPSTAEALATHPQTLPARWGVPSFFGGAPLGPPYQLPTPTAEWALSVESHAPFRAANRRASMAHRLHPRRPSPYATHPVRAAHATGPYLAALFGTTPTPHFLGTTLDVTA